MPKKLSREAAILFFPKLSLLEAALLATMLAPTDAALGKAVVTNAKVPAGVRQGLNNEDMSLSYKQKAAAKN